jgi:GNAT superfamily N-acetyltransferase
LSYQIEFTSAISLHKDKRDPLDEWAAESFFPAIHGVIKATDKHGEYFEIGTIDALYLDVYRAMSVGIDLLNTADIVSSELSDLVVDFYDQQYYRFNPYVEGMLEPAHLNLLSVEKIKIDEKYRGKGIGLAAIQRLIDLHSANCGLVCLRPFPLQYSGKVADFDPEVVAADTNKLSCYYTKAGFAPFVGSNYMVLDPTFKSKPVLLRNR